MFIYTYVYIVQKRPSRQFRCLVTPIKWTIRRRFTGVSAISRRRNRLYTTPIIFNWVMYQTIRNYPRTIRGSNSGARSYHGRNSGTVHGVSSGYYLHTIWQVYSGGPKIIDPCSASETLQATVANFRGRFWWNCVVTILALIKLWVTIIGSVVTYSNLFPSGRYN